jgi:hypothetical protein
MIARGTHPNSFSLIDPTMNCVLLLESWAAQWGGGHTTTLRMHTNDIIICGVCYAQM